MLQRLRNTTGFALQTGLVLALLGAAVPVQAATPITACFSNINVPGTYNVVNDIGPCTAAINIFASDVILNLNGHKISGSNTGTGTGISVGGLARLTSVNIKGPGLIQGFADGIVIGNADTKLDHVTSARNLFSGLEADGATNLGLTSNVFAGNGWRGIFLKVCTKCSVTGNDVSGNGFVVFEGGGIVVLGSNNQVQQNTADGNNNFGIQLGGIGSSANNNTTNGNQGNGILVNGTGSTLQYNAAAGNKSEDMADANASCDSNHWIFNNFFTSNLGCIH